MQRVLIILIFLVGISPSIKAQHDSDVYSRAKYLFDTGQFAVADSMLTSNVATMTNEYREAAYRLLVLSALHQDQYDKAEHYAAKLLDLNPFYTTQVGESPRFADLIYRLKQSSGNTVFTASQMAETLEEAPVPVTLITEEMIKASGATNLHDVLLMYVPGMSDVTSTEEPLHARYLFIIAREDTRHARRSPSQQQHHQFGVAQQPHLTGKNQASRSPARSGLLPLWQRRPHSRSQHNNQVRARRRRHHRLGRIRHEQHNHGRFPDWKELHGF